ncbi:peptidoglycan DD-metalloendopeptidase family protein, partial [Patescibacteria group bacterium]|nr:peptidoglycan DD-metalloendopeptidase family protein [Patescibacteria group bacterium]
MERQYPVSIYRGINANFGQFRSRDGDYKAHDGIDYRAGIGTPVYSVERGTAHPHPADDSLWGRYVIVEHDAGFKTRYAHLDSISVMDGQVVTTSTTLGVSGATDGGADGYSPHLHFGLGAPDVSTTNTINPILEGLKQPLYGDLNIINDERFGHKINLLGTGKDGTFAGENVPLQVVKPGEAVRAIIKAYHRSNDQDSNPYKVVFEVENLTDHSWSLTPKEIVFDNMANIMAKFEHDEDGYYCFSNPFVTYFDLVEDYADYYFVKFYPITGIYKITAKIYSCYRDDFGFHLSEPEVVERTIVVGLVGVDFDAFGYSYAWLPDDIANQGVMLARAKPDGIVAAEVGEGPEIFYAFANNRIITSNITGVSDNFQHKALIESRTQNKCNWIVRIYDSFGNEVDRIEVDNEDWLRVEWGSSAPAGEYTFDVTAQEIDTSLVTTYTSYDTIIIDNSPPIISSTLINSTISSPDQIVKVNIRPSEDLYSLIVNVVNNRDYSLVQERIYSNPSILKDQNEEISWEEAYFYNEGNYNLEFVATDLAGNILKSYSSPILVDKDGDVDPPVESLPGTDTTTPDNLPLVSDVAFDSSGNMFVLYAKDSKLIKYDSESNQIKEVTSYGGTDFDGPLGLAVSSSGDRVYVADTYNNRVVVFDGNLAPVKEIKGLNVYKEFHSLQGYYYFWAPTPIYEEPMEINSLFTDENYKLPVDVIVAGDLLYVIDSSKHRLLKYNLSGDPERFEKELYFRHDSIGWPTGNGKNYVYVRSNTLNDKLEISSANPHHARGFWHLVTDENYGSADGQFTFPQSVVVDASGNIFVLDTGNNRIQKFSPDGAFVSKFGEGILSSPQGIDVDSSGNIWVADTGNNRIVEFNPSGSQIAEYKSDEYEINPHKIVARGENIYIADANFEEPLVWNIAGEISDVKLSDSWFSPNGDGGGDSISISYKLSHPANVSIQILNSESSIDARAISTDGVTVVNEVSRNAGKNEEIWNGKMIMGEDLRGDGGSDSEDQETVVDGNYTLKIIASFGDYKKTETFDIHVDTVKPGVALNRDPPGFSPNGDGTGDLLVIDYSVSDNVSPTAEVTISFLKDDEILGVIFEEEKSLSVDETLTWDGKVGSWYAEADGILELKATDLAGNTAVATAELIVDGNPPSAFSILSPSPEAMLFSGRDLTIEWERPEDTNLSSFNVYISTDSSDI